MMCMYQHCRYCWSYLGQSPETNPHIPDSIGACRAVRAVLCGNLLSKWCRRCKRLSMLMFSFYNGRSSIVDMTDLWISLGHICATWEALLGWCSRDSDYVWKKQWYAPHQAFHIILVVPEPQQRLLCRTWPGGIPTAIPTIPILLQNHCQPGMGFK